MLTFDEKDVEEAAAQAEKKGCFDRLKMKAFPEEVITSGFEKLDNMTNGFKEGELIIIGARPSLGKTTLAVSMVSHICFEQKFPTAFFSLEMSSTKLKSLLIPVNSEANFDAPLYIVDTPNMSLADLCTQAREYCSQQQVKIIFIDYLGLIGHEPMSDISRSLKSLAMELKIPVAALCQLPGEPQGEAPTLADLGLMEQDADLVLFLHRPVNEASKIKMRLTDLILAKQRNGHTGVVKLGITKLLMNGEARRFIQEEEKMKISQDIIKEEIGEMEKRYKKLAKLFEKEESIPKPKKIEETLKSLDDHEKFECPKTYPDLKSNSKYSWLNKDGDKIIYMFSVTNFPYDISEINNKFDKEENISLCRINEKSPKWEKVKKNETVCLYVGSSKKIQQRLKEHLFLCNKNSYAMHLKAWLKKEDLPITINIWDFTDFLKDEEPDSDYLQNIEDLLWNHYQPLFGRQGKK